MKLHPQIKNPIEDWANQKIVGVTSVSGGCIAQAFQLTLASGQSLFLKMQEGGEDAFPKEANGLKELGKAQAIKVPKVYLQTEQFLLLEWIALTPVSNRQEFFERFGKEFARLHQCHSEQFGFYEDNYIGSTPQKNIPSEEGKHNWIDFYYENRLLYQMRLAEKNGYASPELTKAFAALEKKLATILGEAQQEKPSLLHGDLWGGNYLCTGNNTPVLIDPAVYYGHREADLAMTKIFGGFDPHFYRAYQEHYPLSPGYQQRENVYKLYHILNHLNLFGMGYHSQAVSLIKSYL